MSEERTLSLKEMTGVPKIGKEEEKNAAGDMLISEESKKKFLIFSLGSEYFAIPLSYVKEVIRIPKVVSLIPQVSPFIKGVVNLRGQIITLIDLKQRLFSQESIANPKKSCIIIIEVDEFIMGLSVDEANAVQWIYAKNIEQKLEIPSHARRDFFKGATKNRAGDMVLVVDMEKLFSKEEIQHFLKKVIL